MKNFYEIVVRKMTDHETIYSQMTEGEKQIFDLTVDYGFVEDARKMIRNKEADIEKSAGGHKTSNQGTVELVRAAARKGETR